MVAIQRLVVLNLFLLRFTLSNNDRHMVRAFQHSECASHRSGQNSFHHGAAVHETFFHINVVGVDPSCIVFVLRLEMADRSTFSAVFDACFGEK